MSLSDKIKSCYQSTTNYPDLARRLAEIGVQSYTVDTASSTILYRFANGKHIIHPGDLPEARMIMDPFNETITIAAIRDNQQGRTDYQGFMNAIAEAGVRFYEATFVGERRVTYVGIGGMYEEAIA